MKFSIIIPVYNCKLYLKRCIDSIINQKYDNLEVLLVDDGSTDGSDLICDYYASTYDYIKVFHKQNEGVSKARNVGLSKCTGEYVLFVDSDDYLDKQILSSANKILCKDSIDILKFSYIKKANIIGKKYNYSIETDKIIEKKNYKEKLYKYLFNTYDLSNIWGVFIRKDIIDGLQFKKEIKYGEDFLFFANLLVKSHNIMLSSAAYYYYNVANNSAVRTNDNGKVYKSVIDNIYVCNEINKFVNNEIAMNNRISDNINSSITRLFNIKYSIFKKNIQQLNKITNDFLDIECNAKLYIKSLFKEIINSFKKILLKILWLCFGGVYDEK